MHVLEESRPATLKSLLPLPQEHRRPPFGCRSAPRHPSSSWVGTKTDLSIVRKPVLVESAYSSRMSTRGERIKEAREYWQVRGQGRSVLQLCDLVGVSEPTYYNWEGNKVQNILAGNLMKFCKVTGFHPNYIETGRVPKTISEDDAIAQMLEIAKDLTASEKADGIKLLRMLRDSRPKASGE